MKNIKPPQAKDPNNIRDNFEAFYELVKILRKECPWDRKQTNESIAHLTIEEAYEVLDAIRENDDEEFSKELGDILLHVVLHSVMAAERKAFDINKIIRKVHEKMIHRHPHVFGDTEVSSEEDVVKNWEELKKQEGKESALEGVPNSLPALLRAERVQHKASKVGFDWDDKKDVWDKVKEEISEFQETIENSDEKGKQEEFGDLLFALVNAGRHEGIVAEEALHFANKKFIKRFKAVEETAKKLGKDLNSMTLEEMDRIWDEVKGKEIK